MYALMYAYANSDYAQSETTTTETETQDSYPKSKNKDADAMLAILQTYYDKYGVDNVWYEGVPGDGNKFYVHYKETISNTFDPVSYFNTTNEKLSNIGHNDDDPNTVSDMYSTLAATNGFQTYLAQQGREDLDGYIAAMEIINENVNSLGSDGVSTVVTGNYSSLNDMLQAILGN